MNARRQGTYMMQKLTSLFKVSIVLFKTTICCSISQLFRTHEKLSSKSLHYWNVIYPHQIRLRSERPSHGIELGSLVVNWTSYQVQGLSPLVHLLWRTLFWLCFLSHFISLKLCALHMLYVVICLWNSSFLSKYWPFYITDVTYTSPEHCLIRSLTRHYSLPITLYLEHLVIRFIP